MRLRCGDDVVTLGPQLRLKKNTFQGIVLPVSTTSDAASLLERVKRVPRLRTFQHFPHAWRVRCLHGTAKDGASTVPESETREDRPQSSSTCYRVSLDADVLDHWDDDSERGVGDRLLHLLQRWQVENVVVLVARQDDSLSGRLIGPEIFKLMVEAAKLALETYYVESIKPSDVAKIELMEAAPTDTPGGPYQPLSARSPRNADNHSQPSMNQTQHQQPVHAAVCLMTSATIPSWPTRHKPTPDGSGRKGTRQGRINHFLHDRTSAARSKPHAASSTTSRRPTSQPDASDADVTHASGGIDWLGITRGELLQLKSIRVPVPALHALFMCLVVLLDKPPKQSLRSKPTPKADEAFTPASCSWSKCREVLHQSHYWNARLQKLRGADLTPTHVAALRALFQEPALNEPALLRVSVASVKIFAWLQRLLDAYDDLQLGLADDAGPTVPLAHDTVGLPTPPAKPASPPPRQPRPPPSSTTIAASSDEQQLMHEFEHTTTATNPHSVKIVDRGRLFNHASHSR